MLENKHFKSGREIINDSERGIAIVLALITLLIISIMAVSISYVSNRNNFV